MDLLKRKSTNWYKRTARAPWSSGLVRGSCFAVAGLLYLKVWLPATRLAVPCVFHGVTGFYCPGCGLTRALQAYLQLDAWQAFRFNLLVPLLLPLYAAYALAVRAKRKRTGHALMAAMLAMTIAFGVLRNFPSFAWLAPNSQ
ncbi:DUF2752 domain-containing protein [Paenibacillus cymbidii]|uniref:DUF2752 domain-containing protein n=1 Tax=Paenibacillus cymbidii TaxID=1639034 RepID=UPI00107FDBBF|nr:DUF2752 domain-containing protein [Paenibacillus cymbidii]